jgi:hypothetical protein
MREWQYFALFISILILSVPFVFGVAYATLGISPLTAHITIVVGITAMLAVELWILDRFVSRL